MRIIIFGLCLIFFCPLWADSAGYVTALDSRSVQSEEGVPVTTAKTCPELATDVDAQAIRQCVQVINQQCSPEELIWEKRNACVNQALNAHSALCKQTDVLYQKFGLLPNRVERLGSVTVFTLFHSGDGQESFHMIDGLGAVIDLVDDRNATIAGSREFKKIKQKNPEAGLMQMVAAKVSESPQVIEPKTLANKKGEDILQLVFKQYVNVPPCLACQRIAVADIAYRFSSPQGQFMGVAWLKTTQNR